MVHSDPGSASATLKKGGGREKTRGGKRREKG